MARKSKRMTLNEAIRQGQAKIAAGLKTGQMRSDGPSSVSASTRKEGYWGPESLAEPAEKGCVDPFKSKEKFLKNSNLPSKTKLIVALCAAQLVVLALGFWLGAIIMGSDQSPAIQNHEPQAVSEKVALPAGTQSTGQEDTDTHFSLFGFGRVDSTDAEDETGSDSVADKETEDESGTLPPVTSEGHNAIWIQSIALNRKDELLPVAEFFNNNGIETEIIVDRAKGDAVLVTKAGFVENPAKEGTEGNVLLQRIKQLGIVYVEETKDTKFGVKPFQDVLGYKR